ncbi:hypothetical protein SRHO_G00095870 [Serrasalmus rhombeus]
MSASVAKLEDRCEDLEGRSRRNNLRLIGVPEGPSSCSTTAVAALLKEALGLEKEPLLDRSHRSLHPKPKPGERPRAIICRCHHYKDCVDILRRAKELKRINVEDFNIAVFPDHTAKTAKARAAFNDVRRRLRDIEGARYGLLYPARLRITYNGVEKEFVSAEEASSYVKTLANGCPLCQGWITYCAHGLLMASNLWWSSVASVVNSYVLT